MIDLLSTKCSPDITRKRSKKQFSIVIILGTLNPWTFKGYTLSDIRLRSKRDALVQKRKEMMAEGFNVEGCQKSIQWAMENMPNTRP